MASQSASFCSWLNVNWFTCSSNKHCGSRNEEIELKEKEKTTPFDHIIGLQPAGQLKQGARRFKTSKPQSYWCCWPLNIRADFKVKLWKKKKYERNRERVWYIDQCFPTDRSWNYCQKIQFHITVLITEYCTQTK